MSVFSDNVFALQAGSDFIDLTPAITGIGFDSRLNYAAVDLITDDANAYPAQYPTNIESNVDISGLVYEDGNAGDELTTASRQAQFIRINTEDNFAFPICQLELNTPNLVFPNGVVQIGRRGVGQRANGLDKWRFGRILPKTYNSNQASSGANWGLPGAGAWAAILVVKRGGLTALSLTYRVSSTTYTLTADRSGANVIPQLKVGQLLNGNNAAPASAGNWRINRSGSATGAEIYVMVLV